MEFSSQPSSQLWRQHLCLLALQNPNSEFHALVMNTGRVCRCGGDGRGAARGHLAVQQAVPPVVQQAVQPAAESRPRAGLLGNLPKTLGEVGEEGWMTGCQVRTAASPSLRAPSPRELTLCTCHKGAKIEKKRYRGEGEAVQKAASIHESFNRTRNLIFFISSFLLISLAIFLIS